MMVLVERLEGHSACKKTGWGCWHGYLFGARCRLAYGPTDATALTVFSFSKIQIGFTFLVPAHLGSPGKKAAKNVCSRSSLMILEYAVAQLVVAYACRCQWSVSEERSWWCDWVFTWWPVNYNYWWVRDAVSSIWPSWCHCHSLYLSSVKSRLVLPFWYFSGFFPLSQIFSTISYLFFFQTGSTDSPDCLPILLSISVFTLFFHSFSTVSCCSML